MRFLNKKALAPKGFRDLFVLVFLHVEQEVVIRHRWLRRMLSEHVSSMYVTVELSGANFALDLGRGIGELDFGGCFWYDRTGCAETPAYPRRTRKEYGRWSEVQLR
jgi:hypothetical protein